MSAEIPSEAVEAAARALCEAERGPGSWPMFVEAFTRAAERALAAALPFLTEQTGGELATFAADVQGSLRKQIAQDLEHANHLTGSEGAYALGRHYGGIAALGQFEDALDAIEGTRAHE